MVPTDDVDVDARTDATIDRAASTGPPHDVIARRRVSPRTVDLAIFGLYALVVGITIWQHEMWRDELQAWTLTNSATDLRDLFHDLRYEGHPSLWYLVLFPFTRLTDAPEAMQLLQFVIALVTGGLVLRFSPFTQLQRAMLLFGYFIVFEYGTMSRSYGLGMLLTFAVCAVANRAQRVWWLIGSLIAAVALTSAFGAMVAVAIATGLVTDEFVRRRSGDPRAASLQSIAFGATIAIAGVLIAYAQSIPPSDVGEYRGWRTEIDLGEIASTVAALWRSFVPLPQLQREFWNTNLLDGRVGVAAVASVAIVVLVATTFRRKPAAIAMWLIGVSTMLVFLYAKIAYASSGRHFGHLFVLFVAMAWLAPSLAGLGRAPTSLEIDRRQSGSDAAEVRAALLTVVLGLHVVAGAFAVVSDWTTPFSDGERVADYLAERDLADGIIIGYPDTSASTVAAYLDREIYFPQGDRFGNYILWDADRADPTRPLSDVIEQFVEGEAPGVVILRTEPLETLPPRVRLVAVFDRGIVSDEHYWLYAVERA